MSANRCRRSVSSLGRNVLTGLAAGAAGTTALNAVTYLDMAVRGRGTSSAPEDSVETIAGKLGLRIPGDEDSRANRISGLGALTGILTGVGVGTLLGVTRGLGWRPGLPVTAVTAAAAAMAGSDVPMTALGISDPRKWGLADWLSDALPHLAYGLTAAAVTELLD